MISIFLREIEWVEICLHMISKHTKISHKQIVLFYGHPRIWLLVACQWVYVASKTTRKSHQHCNPLVKFFLHAVIKLFNDSRRLRVVVEYKEYIVFDKSISYRYYSITSIGQINRNETKMNRLMPSVYIQIKMRP